ncbi:hypothetical protein [Clostridium cylindrosporum]|uniref:Phage protein n=1 Tax=Clostridium cylindrosporum DSM 605 TaxID=1121307 RepID=A0A0J8D674_CLOCY|nr:hypothetical protein [Clostridium cylindrosporum]KMT21595.1 hypothetical protein CLCY_2c03570 [Clostridium cylindrosporum DSM 605]
MEIDIIEYIESCVPSLKDNLYPLFTVEADKTTGVFSFKPLSGGHIKETQLEFKIIGLDYDEVKIIEKQIIDILDIEEDEASITYGSTYFRSSLSGGGILFRDDLQMYEDTLYFIIRWRCI